MDITPRSGRTKKRSALSKMAASRTKNRTSDDSDIGSRGSLNGDYDDNYRNSHRPHGSGYPIDADVRITHSTPTSEEDSDEGIEMANNRGKDKAYVGSPRSPHKTRSSSEVDDRLRMLRMENDRKRYDDTDEVDYASYKKFDKGGDHASYKAGKRSYREDKDVDPARIRPKRQSLGHDSEEDESETPDSEEKELNELKEKLKQHEGWNSNSLDRNRGEKVNRQEYKLDKRSPLTEPMEEDSDQEENRTSFNQDKSLSPRHKPKSNVPKSPLYRSATDLMETSYQNASDLEELTEDEKKTYDSYKKILAQETGEDDNDSSAHKYKNYDTELTERKDQLDALRDYKEIAGSSPSGFSLKASFDRPWSAVNRSYGCDEMSQRSVQSTSVLQQMTVKEAKKKSFLIGSISHEGSLLGDEQLDRYFPDRKIKVFVGTWNMCEMKLPPKDVSSFILPDCSEIVYDMYIISTQESTSNRKEWEIKLQETLGPQFVLFHSGAHGCLYENVFLKRDLIWYCSVAEEAGVSTRAGPTSLKTKGGVGVCFKLFGTSFLFVNSHLSPHDGKMKERCADYHKICANLDLPKILPYKDKNETDVTAKFDCVFWSGDLNFRIDKERDRIEKAVEAIDIDEDEEPAAFGMKDFDDIMVHDELFNARNNGLAFKDFQEGRITFKPTYKFDLYSNRYDTSKKMRIPSYTDRILYRTKRKNAVQCIGYGSASNMKESDHRPVYALFEVNLQPGTDRIPLAAGQFRRDIWLEAAERRANTFDVLKNDKTSSVCSIQ